jgi:predicted AlkP superfamily pyrophosphatase or phosphodiesterase
LLYALAVMNSRKAFRRRSGRVAFAAVLVALVAWGAAGVRPKDPKPPLLVVVAIDGLRPDYITDADAHGAKVPNLRRFLKQGAYAVGVVGVVPTVTYPSHTTLVTGVWPAKHGIFANTTFDPLQKNVQGWYWYAEDIRAPTLWDAAAKAGRTTASVQWPVTVGAHITWNIPEFWRANTEDDAKLLRAVSTPGLLAEAQGDLGPYSGGTDTTVEADKTRGRYAMWILENKHPDVLTLHLIALDHIEHETSPFSAEAVAVLEALDAVIGSVREAAERLAPERAYVAVVSDHGFARAEAQLDLFPVFRDLKLFTVDDQGKITDWKAMPWVTGGSAAIVLKDPGDAPTRAQVHDLLAQLANDPANGIDRVLDGAEVHKLGGYPTASFFVSLKPGWRTGTAFDGPVRSKTKRSGTHGELPDVPDLRAAFFLVGPGVPRGRSLGIIDMRDIASTLAQEAGLSLPSSDGKNLLP